MTKHVCLFHGDIDGITSAAILNIYLGPTENKTFIKMKYGDGFSPTLVDDETILWIVDYAIPMELLWDLNKICKKIVWYDHHATSLTQLYLPEYINNVEHVIDMNRSGAGITWDELFKCERPDIVTFVEDMDTWKFRHKDTKKFIESFTIDITDPQDSRWSILLTESETSSKMIQKYIESGEILLKAKEKRINKAIDRGYYGTIKGHKTFFVNSTEDISEIGERIYLSHADPIIAAIYYTIGNKWTKYSLRSNSIDVSKIAKEFGGGGHIAAAGFEICSIPKEINRMLENKPEE